MAQPPTKEWDALNRGAGAFSTPGVDTRFVPEEFVPRTAFPKITFGTKNLDPPTSLYITSEDALALITWNSFVGQTVTLTFRILNADGIIIPHLYTVALSSTRLRQRFNFGLTEGFLLSVQLFGAAFQAIRGQTFASVVVIRPATGASIGYQPLFQDYVTATATLGWPGGRIQQSVEGPGAIRSIVGTVPGAGAEVSETVPTAARWKLRALRVQLTTAAVAANREVSLTEDDGANVYTRTPSGFTQIISLVHNYNFYQGGARFDGAQALETVAPIADARLLAGHRIRTVTTNINAADQYTAPTYEVEEWIETNS